MKKKVTVMFKGKSVGTIRFDGGKLKFIIRPADLQRIVQKFMMTPRDFAFPDNRSCRGTAMSSLAFFDRFCLQLWELGLDFK